MSLFRSSWEKAFLSFPSVYSPFLIFLLELDYLAAVSVICSCIYCLLQLSLLSAAAVVTVCCSNRQSLLSAQLPIRSAAAALLAAVAATYRRLLELHYALELLLLLLSQSPCNCSCCYCMLQLLLQLSLQRMQLSVAASAGHLKNFATFYDTKGCCILQLLK
jgi:hypothetical protein